MTRRFNRTFTSATHDPTVLCAGYSQILVESDARVREARSHLSFTCNMLCHLVMCFRYEFSSGEYGLIFFLESLMNIVKYQQ